MKKINIVIIILITFITLQAQEKLILPELGDRVSGAVSIAEEKIIGKEFLKQIYFQAPLISDPLIQEYTELLTYKLSEYSEVQNRIFTVLIIDDSTLNAFAAPGGIIGVNGGLFLNADNEAQFASVMAHELAHLSQRHFARNILNAKDRSLASTLTMISSIALAVISNNPNAMIVGPAMLQTQNLRYSRLFEKEADRVGFSNLIRAGYNPNSMGEMFTNMNNLRRLSGEAPPEFLLTHPLSSSRINDAFNAAEGFAEEGTKLNSLEYSFIKSRLEVFYEKIPIQSVREFTARLNENKSIENIYGLALAHSKNNKHKESEKLINILLEEYPTNLFLNTSKVEILTKSKLLLQMERYYESEEIIRDLLIIRNEDPQLWLLLSEIERSSKNIVGYHQSRAEYFLLLGQNEEALAQLEFASKLTKNNFQVSEKIMDRIISIKKAIAESRGF